MKLGTLLRTLSYGLTILILTAVFLVPAVLILLLPARLRYNFPLLSYVEYFFYRALIASWWVPVTVEGKENIPDNQPVIFAANHTSSIDIPLLGMLARGEPHVWLAWFALTKYPLLGFVIKRMTVLVDTRTPRRAVAALHEAVALLKGNGKHLMIFPEGGRYDDGTIHDFFRGFAILARETNRPVVPVFIENAARVCKPKTIWIHYAQVHIIIGEPFFYQEGEEDTLFLERVHAWFVQTASQQKSAPRV